MDGSIQYHTIVKSDFLFDFFLSNPNNLKNNLKESTSYN